MGMFRSETMTHGTLVLPADRARDFVELLGLEAHLQFVDMNASSMRRQYRKYIQRIDEMERILRFLFEEIKRLPGAPVMTGDIATFLESDHGYELDKVEAALQRLHSQFQKFRSNNTDMLEQKNAAIEAHAVAKAAIISLGPDARGRAASALLEGDTSRTEGLMGFSNMAGVLLADDQEKFARTLFRATRGNVFTHFEPIDHEIVDIKLNKPVRKSVVVTYFQGGTGPESAMREKLIRICQAYGVNLYDWPKSMVEAQDRMRSLEETISDKARALEAYEHFFASESAALLEIHRPGGGSLIDDYRLFCLKEKAIYATLNLFEGAELTLRADCWFPQAEEEPIRRLLMSRSTPSQVSAFLLTDKHRSRQAPPTYIRTTEFTATFQSFVDTYGVPRYKEANPALLTIVTFPFLFGIMYGDIGHGACLLAFGLFLIFKWGTIKKMPGEMTQMIAGGRYMILLMGLFATFAGFLYNDFFSLGLDLFGTRFAEGAHIDNAIHMTFTGDTPYPFGFDPAWKGATNELLFMNSFKMKFAVIVGFLQMTTGIVLKGFNTVYFNDPLSFVFEFVPQLLFMLSLVGFMNLLIIYKWATPIIYDFHNGLDNKPLIINNIIQMCMFQTPEHIAFHGQALLMTVCVVVMLLSVPIMLLPKPFILKSIHQKKAITHGKKGDALDQLEGGGASHFLEHEELEEFDFGEEMIHQMIETIEFVLGAISNTASYLRLWALSLAHQQLSLVFFDMTVVLVLELDMPTIVVGFLLFFVFAVFAAVTFGIMLCMDTLECFLHALRLQWVEFQNKFYKADGYAFSPFNFKATLSRPVD